MVDEFSGKKKEIRHPKELVLGEALRRNAERFPDRLVVAHISDIHMVLAKTGAEPKRYLST
ncbi:MAG: hypothetical protein MOIL_00765 [Candidatus Methanolliviera sp. GoM_oil]|nr:MAG: hypothetical protein MOIL_00765 [Candidatus Methanolliviera sp. GoM_oil]